MESDRTQSNLGQAVDLDAGEQRPEKPKQPKKRFIGRKAAAERLEQNGGSNGTIEDSGAIQGMLRQQDSPEIMSNDLSCTTEKDSSSPQPSSIGHNE